jgi:pseudaminic acid synthase
MTNLKIHSRSVGKGSPAYIIAELSANHNQDLGLAEKTLIAMKEAGADAVKIQSFTPDSMTMNLDRPWFMTRKDSLWSGQKLYDLYKKTSTPYEWHPRLRDLADELGMDFFSAPFDREAVDLLETLQVPAYKIASFEITDIPLISYAASKGKPIIISTGVATEEDIELALSTCHEAGNEKVALLKCTSAYPTPVEESNLGAIPYLREKFNKVVGISDHSLGLDIPLASVALGAAIIEKHFILDKSIQTPDSSFSLDKEAFSHMVASVRQLEKALEEKQYVVKPSMVSARGSARSLFAVQNIRKGEEFSAENMKSLRPGNGLHPKHTAQILGKRAVMDIDAGTPLSWEMIETENFTNT